MAPEFEIGDLISLEDGSGPFLILDLDPQRLVTQGKVDLYFAKCVLLNLVEQNTFLRNINNFCVIVQKAEKSAVNTGDFQILNKNRDIGSLEGLPDLPIKDKQNKTVRFEVGDFQILNRPSVEEKKEKKRPVARAKKQYQFAVYRGPMLRK